MDMFFEGVCGAAILTVVFVVREGLADLATEKDFEELYKQGLQSGRAAVRREQRAESSEGSGLGLAACIGSMWNSREAVCCSWRWASEAGSRRRGESEAQIV